MEGDGDHAYGVRCLPVRRSEFLSREDGAELAEMGAAARGAGPRLAGRFAHPARSRHQRRAQGKAGGAARRRPPRAARARVGYTGLVVRGNSVEVRIREGSDFDQAVDKLRELSQPLGGILGSRPASAVSMSRPRPAGLVRLTVTEPAIVERIRQSVEQSIQIIERRVNELGTVEPLIQRQGADRILVQVPGLQDPTRLKELLGKTAKLEFRMVDVTMPAGSGAAGPRAAGLRNPDAAPRRRKRPIPDREARAGVGRRPDRRPAGLRPAHQRADRHFRFNTSGARKFAQVDAGECRQAVRHHARQSR